MNINNVLYRLKRDRFEDALKEAGFKNHLDFCQKTGLHKNTLQYYLSGRPLLSDKFLSIASALKVNPIDLIETGATPLEMIAEMKAILNFLGTQPRIAVILLGSRARGTAQKYSDWDLGITAGEQGLGSRDFLKIKGEVETLADNLPRSVDCVNLDAAPSWFLNSIDHPLQLLAGNESSFNHFKGVLHGIQRIKTDAVA